jgi:hypothetical protein
MMNVVMKDTSGDVQCRHKIFEQVLAVSTAFMHFFIYNIYRIEFLTGVGEMCFIIPVLTGRKIVMNIGPVAY